jgi:transcriptional regulator with XRE-family HTH domain
MTVPLTRQPLPGFRADVSFGVLLREQRVLSGLTQEELAERSGLSVRAIRNLEIGRTERPQQQSVELLATALGLDELARADLLRAARRRGVIPPTRTWQPGWHGGTCELPPDVPDLTGRELVAPAVTRLLTEGPAPRLALVNGGPGVGKTAFVVHVAHRLRERFPDGQVYVDLDRPEGGEMPPHAVLGRVLRSLGASEPPSSQEERAALLRAALTSRRVLLVLDNVASEAQVRPLLTGASTSAALLASRHELMALPGGHPIRLEPLGADAAVYLLGQLAGVERVRREPDAARGIADACSRLPLALHIAGSWLRARPRRPLSDLAALLADPGQALDRLTVADLSVRASIAGYDRGLRPEERQLAQRLSLLDPDRFRPADLCHQLGLPEPVVQDGVERLAHANLLTPAGTGPDGEPRYRLDPLVRRHFLARHDDAGVTQLRWAGR